MEAIMAYLKSPSQQWPEDTEECHKTPNMIDDNQTEILESKFWTTPL